MSQESPDPCLDRTEFERRVRRSSSWVDYFDIKDILLALIDNDQVKLAEIRDLKTGCEAHIQGILEEYDSFDSLEGKSAVVGAVKKFIRA